MLTEAKDSLIDKLKDFFVLRQEILFAWLFGSYARGCDNRYSDVDIAVYIKEQALRTDIDWYLGLKSELMAVAHREIDLILLNNVKLLIKYTIVSIDEVMTLYEQPNVVTNEG